ncbi:DUF4143 domain-containing protein [Nonomuraea sp. NPDC049421]|uniref:DUF4143 domain-containing protein n=1 Tax=Nonomuraea sp. NPDC049421 TaxID=3155275 RepID=UPI0034128C96
MSWPAQLTWSEDPVQLYRYRDRDGVEVDGILERASGEIIGIEVKSTEMPLWTATPPPPPLHCTTPYDD